MFISHGTVDQVIPVEWARKAAPQLQQMRIEVTYKEYPVGHGVAPQNFWDMLKWLES
ncbi:MAG: alpha/beta hydrolase [Flavobacterium sp.]